MIKKPLIKNVIVQSAMAASFLLGSFLLTPASFADAPEQANGQRFVCTIDPDGKHFSCAKETPEQAKQQRFICSIDASTQEFSCNKEGVMMDMGTMEPAIKKAAMNGEASADMNTDDSKALEQKPSDELNDTPAQMDDSATKNPESANKSASSSKGFTCICSPKPSEKENTRSDLSQFGCKCVKKNPAENAG